MISTSRVATLRSSADPRAELGRATIVDQPKGVPGALLANLSIIKSPRKFPSSHSHQKEWKATHTDTQHNQSKKENSGPD